MTATIQTLARSLARRLPALLAPLVLAACMQTAPATLYTLVAEPPAAAAAQGRLALAVGAVTLPRYLDRPQMVRYGGSYRLDLAESERWGEPLGAMTTRVLIADLAARLPQAQVFLDTDPAAVPPDLGLEVAVARFDADPTGEVVLEARWTLRRAPRDAVVATDTARIRVVPKGSATEDRVAAMSQALARLADAVAARVAAGP